MVMVMMVVMSDDGDEDVHDHGAIMVSHQFVRP